MLPNFFPRTEQNRTEPAPPQAVVCTTIGAKFPAETIKTVGVNQNTIHPLTKIAKPIHHVALFSDIYKTKDARWKPSIFLTVLDYEQDTHQIPYQNGSKAKASGVLSQIHASKPTSCTGRS
jgi:hypothetical protein